MTKQSTIGRMIGFGIGAAILAAAAFTSGTASATPLACSHGGSTGLAYLYVSSSDPTVCIRQITALPVPPGTPSCWDVARSNGLSCVDPVTQKVNIISID